MATVLGYLIGERGEFSGLRVAIPDKGLTIGRDPNQVDLVVDNLLISRRHAQIVPGNDSKLYLVDLQSRNGTHVNGRKITAPVALNNGDKLDFGGEGKVVFVFESADTTSVSDVLKEAFGESVAPVEWKVGDTILGIYEVTGILGQGGMGRVYKVHHNSWNIDLAVKSPLPGLFTEEKAVENFIREAETWVNLNLHPNIVQCFYVRTIGGIPRIFSEYVPGGTLHDWIKHKKLTQLDQILDVAIQFAWGLHAAHEQGIVHQDVKPLNVLMTPDGIAKVSDFGLARAKPFTGDNAVTTPNNMVTMAGIFTRAYCSPEQVEAARQELEGVPRDRRVRLSRATDIWSWAVSVLEMFTGGTVWQNGLQAPDVFEARQGFFGQKFPFKMSRQLTKLLRQCFHVDPNHRPEDMHEVALRLAGIYRTETNRKYHREEFRTVGHTADSLNNRALSLLDLGLTEQADRAWQEALQVDPEHVESVYNSGLHQWRVGRSDDQALAMRLRMVGLKTASWRIALLAAQVELESGDAEAAIELVDAIRDADSHRPEVEALRARVQQSLRNSPRFLRALEGHSSAVFSVFLSGDGRYALSGGRDRILRLWETGSGHCLKTFEGHTDSITSVCLTTDGRYALSGGSDKTLRLWDVASGRYLRQFEGHTGIVNSVCFSVDGRHVLSGGWDTTLRLWDVASGRCLRQFEGHTGIVNSVYLSVDGRHALSGGSDMTLRLWDVASGSCLRTFEGPTNMFVNSVCLSADSRHALSGGMFDKALRWWDVASGRCLRMFEGHTRGVYSVCLSADGQYALSGSQDRTLRWWDVGNGRCLRTFEGQTQGVCTASLSGDGKHALSGAWDGTLRLWKVHGQSGFVAPWIMCRATTGDNLLTVTVQFEEFVQKANQALSEGDVLTATDSIRRARALLGQQKTKVTLDVWRKLYTRLPKCALRGGWLERTLEGHTGGVHSVCLSADGRHALSGSWDKTLRLWEIATGRCLRTFAGHSDPVNSVCLSADGRHALSGGWDKTLRLWDVASGQSIREFTGHTNSVRFAHFTSDARYVLSGSYDKTLRLWEVATGRLVRMFDGDAGDVSSVCLSADSRYVLSGSVNKALRLWEVASGRCLQTFEGHAGDISSVCLSADSRYALSGGMDAAPRLWEVGSGRCLGGFKGQDCRIFSISLSADGRYALSGSYDDTLRLWEVSTGRCLQTLVGHTNAVQSVCLSADGGYALSGGDDGTVRLWSLDWELEDKQSADWDDGARHCLVNFLTLHTPYVGKLPADRQPTDEEVTHALSRCGKPKWSEDSFKELLFTLGCAGYGWLRPEGVRCELEKLAKSFEEI